MFRNIFFIGIAGSGMSALAQYLKEAGLTVSGSDRFFGTGEAGLVRQKLERQGIACNEQDGSGITGETQLVVASSAVEETVIEIRKARQLGIPVMRRAELLALIAKSRKTIAIGGTSGKSTTVGMLFTILQHAGLDPGVITGAGLVTLMKEGKIGNARMGNGEWLIIEADESDGSIVHYEPEIGVLLNVDRDHQEISQLMELFSVFSRNSRRFIVNVSHPLAATFSRDPAANFGIDGGEAGFVSHKFRQQGLGIQFEINGIPFEIGLVGEHNMENALAAAAAAAAVGVELSKSSEALRHYEGIYRRHQVLGKKNGVWVVDDFAHNPVKCAAAIRACQPIASKVVAWFQPHGYGPTRFLRQDFVREIAEALREKDEIWMSEIFYAGGTTTKNISAADLVNDIRALGKKAFFVGDRKELLPALRPHLVGDCVLLLMGARDPSLEEFAAKIWDEL